MGVAGLVKVSPKFVGETLGFSLPAKSANAVNPTAHPFLKVSVVTQVGDFPATPVASSGHVLADRGAHLVAALLAAVDKFATERVRLALYASNSGPIGVLIAHRVVIKLMRRARQRRYRSSDISHF